MFRFAQQYTADSIRLTAAKLFTVYRLLSTAILKGVA